METPKKPAKKTSASTGPEKKASDKTPATKPKSKFLDDDDDDDEFDNSMDDDLAGFDRFDHIDEDEDDY